MNLTLLVREHASDSQPSYVVKIPRTNTPQSQQWAAYEGKIVRSMSQSPEAPPVEVPKHLAGYDGPDKWPWHAYSYVPGDVLTYSQIKDRFSEQEMDRFAEAVGYTILWFSRAVSLKDYARLDPPEPIDRVGKFLKYNVTALEYGHDVSPVLAKLSDWADDSFKFYDCYGAFEPNDIMGQDDIRPNNISFTKQKKTGLWAMSGLFDFGVATPSNRPREARHICLLGRPVARRALQICYGGAVEPMVVHNKYISAEDMAWMWAQIQVIPRRVWDIDHGELAGSVPTKFDRLQPGVLEHFPWESPQAA